jgi:phospholipid/cholesterol/gamma-HCH transport system substrate-binding protein
MPTAQQIAWSKLKVGLMAVAAMMILGTLIFLLTGDTHFFSTNVLLYTYMTDSASLAKASDVRLNGIRIGKVKDIGLSGDNRPRRIIRVTMEVEKKMLSEIPADSVASVSAENVLGSKFINIKKGVKPETAQPGAEITSLDTTDFDDVVQQGYALLTSVQGIVKRVDAIVSLVEVGQGSIGKLLVDETLYNKLVSVANEVEKLTVALNSDKGTFGKLIYSDELYGDVRTSLGRVDSMLADLQKGKGTAGKLLYDDAIYDETRKTLAEVRKVVEDLNAGKGTAGKLLKSDDLHNQLQTSMRKIDTLIDKINAGQGTIGQLLVNPALYDSLNGTMREAQALVKDIHANPKKFLRIKLGLF